MIFDKKKLKEVAGSFPTGVTVISVKKPMGGTHGMTASSFLSLSLNLSNVTLIPIPLIPAPFLFEQYFSTALDAGLKP